MSACIHCSEPSKGQGYEGSCCWARALEIKKFKKLVFHKYIVEVLFDLILSVASVVTDIISLIFYFQKGHPLLAILTAIPVLLPTLVFTNVYMADETQGHCKLPAKRPPSSSSNLKDSMASSSVSDLHSFDGSKSKKTQCIRNFHSKLDFHWPSCHFFCNSCHGFWGGMFHSLFTKDRNIRKSGMNLARKSIKRLSKYFFGTFFLRFIALAWYFKALNFGIKAFKEPKKFMKIQRSYKFRPNAHWSYDLLVRLDFLQAALQNAPQFIVQLVALLTYADGYIVVGVMTYIMMIFSFMNFVRVSVSVQWDIRRGPVIAPSGCFDTIAWKLLNICSWIFLYMGRSAAITLIIATAQGWSISIPVILLVSHLFLFGRLFSKTKYGVAAQKVFVSVFISIFFLPEFESTEQFRLTQLYYAVVHVQNVLFIIPWNGAESQYCEINNNSFWKPKDDDYDGISIGPRVNGPFANFTDMPDNISDDSSFPIDGFFSRSGASAFSGNAGHKNKCFIDPHYIIMAVPCLTIIGIVMRLAASKKMAEFKASIPKRQENMIMEERVAKIYSKKWTQMSIKHMTSALIRMLRKEVVTIEEDDNEKNCEGDEGNVYFISKTLNREFRASQQFIRSAFSTIFAPSAQGQGKTQRSMSVDAGACSFTRRRNVIGHGLEGTSEAEDGSKSDNATGVQRSKSHDDVALMSFSDSGGIFNNGFMNSKNVLEEVGPTEEDYQVVRMDCPEGPYFLEMTWI